MKARVFTQDKSVHQYQTTLVVEDAVFIGLAVDGMELIKSINVLCINLDGSSAS